MKLCITILNYHSWYLWPNITTNHALTFTNTIWQWDLLVIPCNCIYNTTVSKCKSVCLKSSVLHTGSFCLQQGVISVSWFAFLLLLQRCEQSALFLYWQSTFNNEAVFWGKIFWSGSQIYVKLTRTIAFSTRNMYHHQRKKIPQSQVSRHCFYFVNCGYSASVVMRKYMDSLCLAIPCYICMGENGRYPLYCEEILSCNDNFFLKQVFKTG